MEIRVSLLTCSAHHPHIHMHTYTYIVNVMLSLDETYADIMPVRINKDSPSAYV